jgi:hypothetical protein
MKKNRSGSGKLLTYICLVLAMQGTSATKAIMEDQHHIRRIDKIDRKERKRHKRKVR